MVAASGLGEGESPRLNLASLLEALTESNLLTFEPVQAALPMVKVTRLEGYPPFVSKYGLDPGRYGVYTALLKSVISFFKRVECERSEIIRFKGESDQPKGSVRILLQSSGLPTGRNSYGNRVAVVPSNVRGRATVVAKFNCRSYSTDRATNATSRLNYLMKLSKKSTNEPIRMNVYKILTDPDFLYNAYQKIKSKPGNMTRGISSTTLDGMSGEIIIRMTAELKSEKFQFSPARRIQIPKTGGTPPLTIAPPRDKIVQEGMRIILNAIFEPTFLDVSHGFRPNRSCHTALKYLKTQFQPCT